jgi:asparagine synthase (glutamine-hydrolysing)
MARIAEAGYRISLSGTAADEIFTGYFDHHNAYLYEMRGQPELYKEALANWRRDVGRIVRNPLLQNPACFVDNPAQREHIYLNADRFQDFLYDYRGEPFREETYSSELLRNRMLNELFHESVPVILHEDDLNAMYFSIENRSPFLDRRLVEFCYTVPTRHLIQNGRAKALLREAMRGLVPDPILDNPRKVGFNAPIFDLLDVSDPEVVSSLLDPSPIFELVKRAEVEAMLRKPRLQNSESKFLFYFLGCKIFMEEYGA